MNILRKGKKAMAFLLSVLLMFSSVQVAAYSPSSDEPDSQIVLNPTQQTFENGAVKIQKSIAETGRENEFDITLNVVTTQNLEELTVSPDAATVLVLDTSNSMVDNNIWGEDGWKTRLYYAQKAACEFIDNFANASQGAKRKIAVVKFATDAKTVTYTTGWGSNKTTQTWFDVTNTTDKNRIKGLINGLSSGGGTNVDGGLRLANNNLNRTLNDSSITNTNVILLTDGRPTFYGKENQYNNLDEIEEGGGTGSSMNNTTKTKTQAAVNKVKQDGHLLYTISYAASSSETSSIQQALGGSNKIYSAGDIDKLYDAFEDINEWIEKMAEAWKVTDPMGEYIKYKELLSDPNRVVVTEQNNSLVWNLRTSDFVKNTIGNTTTYTYTLKYRITLDNTKAGFVEGRAYDTNGSTTLYYIVKQNGTTMKENTVNFTVPKVKGYLADVSFVKKDKDSQKALSGVTFTLTGDNGVVRTAVSKADGSVLFTDVPSGASYKLKETAVPAGYTLSDKEYTVNISYGSVTMQGLDGNSTIYNEKIKTSVSVNKVWRDGDNQDGIRPDSILVQLYANNQASGEPVALNQHNSWSHTFENLPAFDGSGSEITYTVQETAVPEGYKASYSVSQDGKSITITNTHTPEVIQKTAQKIWDDADNQDGIRPKSVTIQLYANGKPLFKEIVLTELNNWGIVFETLPKYENGKEIAYTIEEVNVPEGYEASYSEDGFTVTNKHVPAVVGKTVQKVWDDGNNQDGKRPESISVQLLSNGTAYGDAVTLNAESGWSYEWRNLPKFADGKEITYTVVETGVPDDYSVNYSDGSFTITNSYTPETTSKTVNKIWDDGNNQDGIRPESVKMQLYADSKALGSAVTLTADGGWAYTWENLPVYKDGVKIEYTVRETSTPEGYAASYSDDSFTVTNKHVPEQISKTIQKVWDDGDNQDGIRPQSVSLQLFANGSAFGGPVEVKADAQGKWSHTFTNLPKYANGQEITYTVSEPTVPQGYTPSYNQDTLTVTNIHTPEVIPVTTVSKVWNDADNQDGIRPESVQVQLYADGKAYGSPVTLKANAEGFWTHTFKNLPKFANGKEITYTIREVNVPEGYEASYSEDGFTITNTHIPETTQKTAEKVWDDGDNQDGIRPGSISVQLYANGSPIGEAVTLHQNNGWSHTFDNLPKFAGGKEITYTVQETAVPDGYDVSYSSDTFTITNSHTPAVTDKTVQKKWADGGNQDGIRPDSLSVQLYADGKALGNPVALNGVDGWAYTWNNLPVYKDGAAIQYTVKELEVPDGYDVSYGDDGFTITNTHSPEVTSKTVQKVWDDGDNQDGMRPQSISVQLLANGEAYGEAVTLNANDGWSHTWNNLPVNEAGEAIEYTVEETDVPDGYTATQSDGGFTITNTHSPEVTSKTVQKVWNDQNNQDGKRPQSVTVQLLANGEAYGSAVTLNAAGGWKHTFTDLPVNKAGKAIEYTVVETAVPQDYSVSYSADTFTITNSYTPEVTSKTVNKLWTDGDNQDGIRPDSVSVQLYADGEAYGGAATLTAEGGWNYTWGNLPVYKDGVAIEYTVKEIGNPDGYTASYSDDTFTITNTHIPAETSKTVKKVWDDQNNQDGIRPQSVMVQLYADGEAYGTAVTLNAANNWSHTFSKLPVNKAGEEIEYTIEEVATPDGYTASYSDDGFTITNTHTPAVTSKTVLKIWDDKNNQDGIRPGSVFVQLFADGEAYGDEVMLSEVSGWAYTWQNLPVNKNGKAIEYTAREVATPDGYTVSYSDDGFAITNTHVPAVTEKAVTKVWNDQNNQDGKRPQSVSVQLLANGTAYGGAVTLNAANEWAYTWQNLPVYQNGQTVDYTIVELLVPDGYEVSYSDGGSTVTNTYTPETTSKTVNKIWNDAGNQDGIRPDSVKVQLFADGEVLGDEVALTEAGGWSHTWDGLPVYKDGERIVYTVNEVETPDGYTAAYSDDTFTITNSHTPATVNKTVNKVWNDQNDQDGIRPQSITVQLFADGEALGAPVALTAENGWNYSWNGLAAYQNGKAVTYTVQEVGTPDGYSVSASGDTFTIVNTHTPAVTSKTVTKVWDDQNNQDGLRPKGVAVQLYANGEAIGTPVTLSAATNWSYTWNDLALNAGGAEIVYTVQEVAAPDGYTASYSDDSFVVTNTHAPETTSKTVTKVWDDQNNQDGKRPQSVSMQLLANGSPAGASVSLNEQSGWSYTWNDLPVYQNGEAITYTVTEVAVPTGYSVSYSDDGFTVTNTYAPEVTAKTIQKVWDDQNNQDGIRSESVKMQLYADGERLGDEVTLSNETNWAYTWNELPVYKDGAKIKYSVQEVNTPDGYLAIYSADGFVITNQHTPAVTERSVTKVWDDNDNQDGIRPNSVKVQLYADGEVLGEPVTLNAQNDWAHTFSNLPVNKAGVEIAYTVQEIDTPDGYTATVSEDGTAFTVTNTHTPAVTEKTVTKIWNDQNNQDGIRPESVKVQLYADGEKLGDEVTLTAENGWTHTFTGLPLNANGKAVEYTVQEVETPEGYTVSYSGDSFLITNTHTPDVTEKTVQKVWNDQNDQDGIRPESIKVQLYADGEALGAPVILNEQNDWAYTWDKLPLNKAGEEITYTVLEIGAPEGYTVSNSEDTFTITNQHTPAVTEKTVTKVWVDNNNQDGKRPDSVSVQLYANGKAVGDVVTLTEADGWTYTFTGLAVNENGKPIAYTVKEVNTPDGYTATYGEGSLVVTNTHTPETTSKTVTKVWEDNNNQDGKRPQSVSMQLLADGSPVGASVSLNEQSGWSYTWNDLPVYQNGEAVTYTVTEVAVPTGYSVSYSDDGFTVTNTYTPEVTAKTIQKVWDDQNNQDGIRPDSVNMQLYADGEKLGDEVTLSNETNWAYTWNELPVYKDGAKINYTVQEVNTPDGYLAIYSADGFVITNQHTPAVTERSVTKVWDDNDNQDGMRPDSVTVRLMANGSAVGENITLSENNGWSYTFENLPVNAGGEAITYTVQEIGTPDGYTATVGEDGFAFTVTNTHTPAVTEKTVTKVWDDQNNQDGIRPGSVRVQLYADGEALGGEVTLSERDGWTHTFTDLPLNQNGKAVEYTVKEVGTPDGYTASYSADSFVITNTHTPAVTEKTVQKLWDDQNNQDGIRPAGVSVQLYANGKALGTPVTLTAASGWSYSWNNLPVNENGRAIEYTVQETAVPQGYEVSYTDGSFTITNTHTPAVTEKTVTKLWDDNDNQDGLRPDSVEVQLYANGSAYGSPVTVTERDGWTYTWKELPLNANGEEITYTVQEVNTPAGYGDSYSDDTFTITNLHIPAVTERTVQKLWDDQNNQDGIRPSGIAVQLYANGAAVGSPVSLTAANNWTHTFENLALNANGEEIEYTVQEVNTPNGYDVSYSEDSFIITNTHAPELTEKTVTKVWDDQNNQDGKRPEAVTMQLLANGSPVGEAVTLTEEGGWSYTFNNLPVYSAGKAITYTVVEVAVPDGYSVSYSEDTFTVTNSYTPETSSKTVNKIWDDGDNQDNLRPASVTVQLYANGTPLGGAVTLSAGSGWSHTWNGLDVYEGGQPIAYTVREVNVPTGYEAAYSEDGFTITNTHTPSIATEVTVNKVDSDNVKIVSSSASFVMYRESDGYYYAEGGKFVESREAAKVFSTQGGSFVIPTLAYGTYYLVETEAPDGYAINTQPVKLVVDGRYVTADVVNQLRPAYNVYYDANGGEGTQVDRNNPYYAGDSVTVLDEGSMTYEGFLFDGWNTMPDGTGTPYNEGDTFNMPARDVVLYAQWIGEIIDIPDDPTPEGPGPNKPNKPNTPGGTVNIPDDDVPLGDKPKTGDSPVVPSLVMFASVAGLAVLALSRKKKK